MKVFWYKEIFQFLQVPPPETIGDLFRQETNSQWKRKTSFGHDDCALAQTGPNANSMAKSITLRGSPTGARLPEIR